MRWLLAIALVAFSVPAPAPAQKRLSCAPLPGIESVIAKPDLDFILFGEYHGTIDMPALFGDAVCNAAMTRRPLVVGIELTPSDQSAIDVFMASRGTAAARTALLAAPGWREEGGRTTTAILDLLESIRRIGEHHSVRVIAFDMLPEPGTSARREQAMADALIQARNATRGSLVIAFTGIGHADKTGWTSQTPPFASAAQLLPAERTLSFAFARPGGAFWGCRPANGGTPEGCKRYEMPVREPVSPRGIVLNSGVRTGFDGVYSVGRQYRASRPAL
ncbi:hypothetical protein [Sphingomonas cavernae]|uniref:Calcium-binding protein n=1 Tax=Sphingomonas cavernae TaxID=2320861 RepID=A0A418WJM2_9SPHN|nr:hypothetical protein [Sphingomonas cavernae]RJF90215.1 hypothetical protein D3876_07975 [Sphingomonas cavernae]